MTEQYFGAKIIDFGEVNAGQTIERLLSPNSEYLDKKLSVEKFNGGGCVCTGKPLVEMLRQHDKSILVKYKLNSLTENTKVISFNYTNGDKESYIMNWKIIGT